MSHFNINPEEYRIINLINRVESLEKQVKNLNEGLIKTCDLLLLLKKLVNEKLE